MNSKIHISIFLFLFSILSLDSLAAQHTNDMNLDSSSSKDANKKLLDFRFNGSTNENHSLFWNAAHRKAVRSCKGVAFAPPCRDEPYPFSAKTFWKAIEDNPIESISFFTGWRAYNESQKASTDISEPLETFINKNTSLKRLHAQGTSINNAKNLLILTKAPFLIHLSLTRLDLDSNPMDVTPLCSGLENNTTLTQLNLNDLVFKTKSMSAFQMMLSRNTTLKVLRICPTHCTVGLKDDDLTPICSGLMNNSTLSHLDIVNNDFTDLSFRNLLKALTVNTTLKKLEIGSCNFTDKAIPLWLEILKFNQSLTSLLIYSCTSDYFRTDIISAALPRFQPYAKTILNIGEKPTKQGVFLLDINATRSMERTNQDNS